AIIRDIQLLELYLLHHDHHLNPQHLDNMLAPDFHEIASNGMRVERDAVLEWLLAKDVEARWDITAFSGRVFGRTGAHVVYHARQIAGARWSGKPSAGSWRSSIWQHNRQLDMWQ